MRHGFALLVVLFGLLAASPIVARAEMGGQCHAEQVHDALPHGDKDRGKGDDCAVVTPAPSPRPTEPPKVRPTPCATPTASPRPTHPPAASPTPGRIVEPRPTIAPAHPVPTATPTPIVTPSAVIPGPKVSGSPPSFPTLAPAGQELPVSVPNAGADLDIRDALIALILGFVLIVAAFRLPWGRIG